MDDDKLAFLDGEAEDDLSEEQAEPEAETPEAADDAPQEAEATGDTETTEPPSVEQEAADRNIPISALLDEREKRQKLEREREELRQKQQSQEPEKKPDFWENPEAAISQVQEQVEQRIMNERLNFSEQFARQTHGDEAVEAATKAFQEAAQKDPALAVQLRQQNDPYGFVIGWHKKQSFLEQVGDDPDAWMKQKEAEIRERLQAEMQPSRPQTPPKSLASAPSAGGDTATTPGSAFDALFGDD